MAAQSGFICRFLWTTVAILFVVHYSEEDCTGTQPTACNGSKIVVICEPLETMLTCSDNCSLNLQKQCVYDFHPDIDQGTTLTPRQNELCISNSNRTFIHNVMKNEAAYYIAMHDSILDDNVTVWITKNYSLLQGKPSQKYNVVPLISHPSLSDPEPLRKDGRPAYGPVYPRCLCGESSSDHQGICKDTNTSAGYFILVVKRDRGNSKSCVNCTRQGTNTMKEMEVEVNLTNATSTEGLMGHDGIVSATKANDVLEGLKSVLDKIGTASTAAVAIGDITGGILKLQKKKDITLAFSKKRADMMVSNPNASKAQFRWSIDIPTEAVNVSQSVNNGSGVAAILRFPTFTPDAKNSTVLSAVYGISMAARITNLSDSLKMYFENNEMEGTEVMCSSWDGVGKQPNWTQDGCITEKSNSTITCKCSHLTFFAILMSLPPTNDTMSESDLNSLTYITYIGCGLSMFFLGVALFMHYLLRKAKSSQAIHILMNLFVALFLLNLAFLTNEWVANTGSYAGCVIMATVMHYSMLATFTWFAMQALHLYLHLVRMADTRTYKHYMLKMCIPAWVCPAVVVIILASLNKYQLVVITASEGYQAKMCWITDTMVHYVVNIGYYTIVFLFSLGMFVMMVQRILVAQKMKAKDAKPPSTSKNLTIIMSLLVLLGITWGVAFFSYGPMVIPSYYIFCILNSFQGLFMFIYYYNNSKEFIEEIANPFKSDTTSSITYVTQD